MGKPVKDRKYIRTDKGCGDKLLISEVEMRVKLIGVVNDIPLALEHLSAGQTVQSDFAYYELATPEKLKEAGL